jgi:hypothetical protein
VPAWPGLSFHAWLALVPCMYYSNMSLVRTALRGVMPVISSVGRIQPFKVQFFQDAVVICIRKRLILSRLVLAVSLQMVGQCVEVYCLLIHWWSQYLLNGNVSS